jgi:hypothetical protein
VAKRKSSAGLSSGTYVERRMFESRAFLSLQGSAPQLLVLFLGKRNFDRIEERGNVKYMCMNPDSICFTYAEAKEKYGFTKTRFLRGIDELLAKGFTEVKHQGGGYKRDKSIFALSPRWEFWVPGTVFEKRKKDPVSRGFRHPNRNKKGF